MFRIINPINETRIFFPDEESMIDWLNINVCFFHQSKARLMKSILPVLDKPGKLFLGLIFSTAEEAFENTFIFTAYHTRKKTTESKYCAIDREDNRFYFRDLKDAYWWILSNGITYSDFEPIRAKISRVLNNNNLEESTAFNLLWEQIGREKVRIKDGVDGIKLLNK